VKKINKGRTVAITLLLFSVLLAGCRKTLPTEQKTATTQEISSPDKNMPAATTEVVDVIDITELEESLFSIPLDLSSKMHYIYSGTIGEEIVFVDVWFDQDTKESQVLFTGDYHSDVLKYDCELLEDGMRYHDEKAYLLLKEQKQDELKGYYYESGNKVLDVQLSLKHINANSEKDRMYSIGTNEEVEAFAQKIIDAVNMYDIEMFADCIQYPTIIKFEDEMEIENKQQILERHPDAVFSNGFIENMRQAYPNFLFEDANKGVMIGGSAHNVYFNKMQDGTFKIVKWNN